MAGELKVIEDCYGLCLGLAERIARFPRVHRFALGADIQNLGRLALGELIRVKYLPEGAEKLERLRSLNVELEVLRFHLRLAHDLKALPHEGHLQALQDVQSIGRQIGGWIKSLAAKLSA